MSIRIRCPNGHRLVAKDELAGRRIKCPKCKAITTIPVPDEEVIDLSEDALLEETPEPPLAGSEAVDPLFDGDPMGFDPLAADLAGEDALADLPDAASIPVSPVTPANAAPTALSLPAAQPGQSQNAPEQAAPDDDSPSVGLVAACAASLTSLAVGVILLVVLLLTRGGEAINTASRS